MTTYLRRKPDFTDTELAESILYWSGNLYAVALDFGYVERHVKARIRRSPELQKVLRQAKRAKRMESKR